MPPIPVKAVTFDLWDTLIRDDSDEPKRATCGLLSKPAERRRLVHEFVSRRREIDKVCVDAAYDTVDAAFRAVWYGQSITWSVRERLGVLLQGLGCDLPEDEMSELVALHENMELEVRPDFVPNLAGPLCALKEKYRLGVISDAIFSPGRALRELLRGEGLLDLFDVLIFSDEIGCSKPDERVFQAAAVGLDVDVTEIVHIGDREQKDVEGPLALGARSIFCTAVKDRGSDATKANAIVHDFSKLPATLEMLEKMRP